MPKTTTTRRRRRSIDMYVRIYIVRTLRSPKSTSFFIPPKSSWHQRVSIAAAAAASAAAAKDLPSFLPLQFDAAGKWHQLTRATKTTPAGITSPRGNHESRFNGSDEDDVCCANVCQRAEDTHTHARTRIYYNKKLGKKAKRSVVRRRLLLLHDAYM